MSCGQPLRRDRRRLGLRRLGDGLPAGRGRQARAGARARAPLPAGFVHAQPVPGARELLGPAARARRACTTTGRSEGIDALVSRRARRRLADLRQRLHPQGRELVRPGGPHRRRLRVLAGQPRRPRSALRPRRADDRPAAVSRSTTSRTPRRRRRSPSRRPPRPTAWSGSCPSSRSRSPTRAARRCRARRSWRRSRTSTAARARPASCAASATSAATTAPRTRSITTTSRTRSTTARRSARWPTCAGSSRAKAAATRSATPTSSEHPEDPPIVELTCDHLILSAGTLGTTNLLLKNRSAFPGLSRKLGSALLRQRRPADAGDQHHARRPTASARRGSSTPATAR